MTIPINAAAPTVISMRQLILNLSDSAFREVVELSESMSMSVPDTLRWLIKTNAEQS